MLRFMAKSRNSQPTSKKLSERDLMLRAVAQSRLCRSEPYRWKDWAAPLESPGAKANKRKELDDAGDKAFISFVNGELIPHLKKLRDKPHATPRQKVISEVMSGVEKTRIDTEKNLLDVLDKVHEITNEGVEHVRRGVVRSAEMPDFAIGSPQRRPVSA